MSSATSDQRSVRGLRAVHWTLLGIVFIGAAAIVAGLAASRAAWLVAGVGLAGLAVAVFAALTLRSTRAPSKQNFEGLVSSTKHEAPVEYEQTTPAPQLVEFKAVGARPKPSAAMPAAREGAWPESTQRLWKQRQRERLPVGEFEVPPAFKKRREFTRSMPLVRSVLEDDPPKPPPGKTRGRCGGCETYLWAPETRPIRLRCPKCGRVALLES
jgi:hypothetical protein